MAEDIRPIWEYCVPRCSREACPHYFGPDECNLMVGRIASVCEPAVVQLHDAATDTLGYLDYIRRLNGDEGIMRRVADQLRQATQPEPRKDNDR